MAFGLTPTGFNRKKQTDILESIETRQTDAFGPIDTSADSVFGQLNGVFSEALSEAWEAIENDYLSWNPDTAEGVALDARSALNNITRLPATPSKVTAIVEGDEGTTVPAGTQFRDPVENIPYQTSEEGDLTDQAVTRILFDFDGLTFPLAVAENFEFDLAYNASGFSSEDFDSSAGIGSTREDAIDQILASFVGSDKYTVEKVDVGGTNYIQITTTAIKNPDYSFAANYTGNLTPFEIWSPIPTETVDTGPIPVPNNVITEIVTPVAGMNQVKNLASGDLGSDIESDTDYRVRRKRQVQNIGSATLDAIQARVLNEVEDVTAVSIRENSSDVVDDRGLPPHSYELIVQNGDEAEIGQKIWDTKPAGIQTFGTVVGPCTDQSGKAQEVFFNRPVNKFIHFKIIISLNNEETFPTDGVAQVIEKVVNYGNSLSIGEELIIQRFFEAIYEVPGILNIENFQFAVTADGLEPVEVANGVNDGVAPFRLIDSSATFITDGVIAGMVVYNEPDGTYASVRRVLSETELSLNLDIFSTGITLDYYIGGFGPTNITIGTDQIPLFSTDTSSPNQRASVTVQQ